MPLRVIAGTAKGRRLQMVPGDKTRPVMDRVKEACFSIIGRHIRDATFLDLFAGTGSVAIEALSRGAQQAVLVEMDRDAVKTIQANLERTGMGDRAIIRRTSVLTFLKQRPNTSYDYIYIAPPQYKKLWQDTLRLLDNQPDWLATDGTIIVQIDPKEQETIELTNLAAYDERKYGKTLLWFFTHQTNIDDTPE